MIRYLQLLLYYVFRCEYKVVKIQTADCARYVVKYRPRLLKILGWFDYARDYGYGSVVEYYNTPDNAQAEVATLNKADALRLDWLNRKEEDL